MITCAIVGAGFSGTALICQLVEKRAPCRLILIEKEAFGVGVAYSTNCPAHLLNIPAESMSLFPQDPDHFARWAQSVDPKLSPTSFVPRLMYRAYLQELLAKAEAQQSTIEKKQGCVTLVEKKGDAFELTLANGEKIAADIVVLAMGNQPASQLPLLKKALSQHPGYVHNPWGTRVSFPRSSDILLIGTGLTMVDQVMALREQGHQGTLHALSRRGFLPRPQLSISMDNVHAAIDAFAAHLPQDWKALSWLRYFRRKFQEAAKLGINEAEAQFAEYRLFLERYDSLPKKELAQALRHLKAYINPLIHRIPSAVDDVLQTWIREKRLVIHKGSLNSVQPKGKKIEVAYKNRQGAVTHLAVDGVVNCLGPVQTFEQLEDPLLLSLFRQGIVRPSFYNFILETGPNLNVIDREGHEVEKLFALGALSKIPFSPAPPVPLISLHAHQLAEHIDEIAKKGYSKAP